jgi:type IV pilus assembly protein PilW
MATVPPSRGLSLVEMMVGIAVGMMVVAGASFVAVNQIGENRQLFLETQVQQDLRATADMVARDLRRAGYWGAAQNGVWVGGAPAAGNNPYAATAPSAASAPVSEVTFTYSRGVEDGVVDAAQEEFGFKLEGGVVKMLIGGAWQALTDANVLEVTRFDVALQTQTVQQHCFKECAGGGTACWPTEIVRRFIVDIEGHAVSDPRVARSVRDSVRLRNDTSNGACPA